MGTKLKEKDPSVSADKNADTHTVYLHHANRYSVAGRIYERGNAFTGSKADCEHLLNQRKFGDKGDYIWETTPPKVNGAEGRRVIEDAPARSIKATAKSSGQGDDAKVESPSTKEI